ncbi:hypothetical protein LJB42_002682 [Komagataella kurtzmanii]|nr:hypothetical protein LJB42_002682 [Komagataella kurtzmanii]
MNLVDLDNPADGLSEQPRERTESVISTKSRVSVTDLINPTKSSELPPLKSRNSVLDLCNPKDVDISSSSTPDLSRRVSETSNGEITVAKPKVTDATQNANSDTSNYTKKSKPKRYKVKPVWARDFVPKVNLKVQNERRTQDNHSKAFSNLVNNGPTTSSSRFSTFTGVIPYDDLTRSVTTWLYANLNSLSEKHPNLEDILELEIKVGEVVSKATDKRIQLPVITETTLNNIFFLQECYFSINLEPVDHQSVEDFFKQLLKESKVTALRTDTIDRFFSHTGARGKKTRLRVTQDTTTKRGDIVIEKDKKSSLVIHLPKCRYDLKLTIALELPQNIPKDELIPEGSFSRRKHRTSYIHKPSATQVDLTKVYEGNSKQENFEMELEIDSKQLLDVFKGIGGNNDYESLIGTFLDNAKILMRELSKK